MTIKQSLLISFLIFFNIALVQAQSISGKILSTDNEAIAYATIQIGEKDGTISNEEGDFNIDTEGFLEKEIVKISYLGFETIEITLDQFTSKDYILKERFDELSEVFLTNKKLTLEEILQNVRDNVTTNYNRNTNSKVFYRTSSFDTPKKMEFEILKASELSRKKRKSVNTQFEELSRLSVNKTSSNYEDILLNYSRLEDSLKFNVIKATRLINDNKDKSTEKLQEDFVNIIGKQLDSGSTYKVKTGLFKIEDSLKVGDVFNEKKDLPKTKELTSSIESLIDKHRIPLTDKHRIYDDSYFSFIFNETKNEFLLDGVVYLNDNPVYKISFVPKRKSEKFEGVFYVNTDDFAVVKVDYKLGENRYGKRLNLKALVGLKFVENKIKGSILYKKGEDGFYKPQFINN